MKTFKVSMSNSWTNKTKVRIVQANEAWEAERKARSNSMMANGWVTEQVLLLTDKIEEVA